MIYSDVLETLARYMTCDCQKIHCVGCGLDDSSNLGVFTGALGALVLCDDCGVKVAHDSREREPETWLLQ